MLVLVVSETHTQQVGAPDYASIILKALSHGKLHVSAAPDIEPSPENIIQQT